MGNKEILEFYKQTSQFTDLGYYKEFAKNLPNDIDELCILQRMQIIHPVAYNDKNIRSKSKCFWGDMTKVPIMRLDYEEDYFPTAQSMIAELLRKNPNYNINREAKDKIHITCRGQAILLASILKAKGIPARARSGFAPYIKYDGISYDHWITEYYDEKEKIWKLVDADEHCPDHEMGFDLNNIPYDRFIFGANAYLGLRENSIKPESILYASDPITLGMRAALRGLFYDFHALMNNEIIFLHVPRYIKEKDFELSEEEYKELDDLARLMLNPNENFITLKEIWESTPKYRILCGALNDISTI
ncbi:MAG: transglutaminase domain-containing protein [Bacilli bacterium]|nr:transglutaminase domain-containing protein [Bacilli bacterium]